MQVRTELAPLDAERTVELVWSDSWTVVSAGSHDAASDTTLVVSAGADLTVAIDGVTPEWVRRVEGWAHGESVPPSAHGPLIDRLVEVGALTHATAATPLTVALSTDQPPQPSDEGATDELLAHLTDAHLTEARLAHEDPADLTLVLRTGPTWPAGGPGLHLGIDLTLHHTVQLGPLVIPGVTACLACLATRLDNRWGPPQVPSRPGITRRMAVVAALLDVHLELIAGGVSPLVNATATWDLERATTDHQAIYRVPGCPTCASTIPTGRVSLPWAP